MSNATILTPNDHQKSFYGKAYTFTNLGETFLVSYDTVVCKVTRDGRFVRLWDGYSATTMRHVNAFLAHMGIEGGGKAWWLAHKVNAA